MIRAYFWVLPLLFLTACQRQEPVTKEASEAEPHPQSFTNWTTKTELFAEYPPLVAGQTSRFAVHLTRLDNFKPLAAGRVEIRLSQSGGKVESFATSGPSRPGIFGVDVKPSSAGEYKISVHVTTAGLKDKHELGDIEVSRTEAAAVHENGAPAEETIAFLKEQQWTLDFSTAVIEDRHLRSGIRVPAEVLPRTGGEAEVAVPFDGRLAVTSVPAVGTQVAQGQILANLVPPTSAPSDLSTLELARSEANLSLQLARKDRERAERLVTFGAAPAKRLDEARTVEATVEARLKAADVRLAQYDVSSTADLQPRGARLFALRAPISGVVLQTSAASGANVRAGATVFRIIDVNTVYISAIVPEAELPRIRRLSGAELEAPGMETPMRLTRLVSVGRVVDPQTRTFPVLYQFDNQSRTVAIHQTVSVRLLTQTAELSPAIPESAIVDDGGRPVIFIQRSGEAFVRKPVTLGLREAGYVQVLEGAMPGQRVVTKGAHLIRLSAMSNQVPAHGHVH